MLVYVLFYQYDDYEQTIGAFSSEEEIVKYVKNTLTEEFITNINKLIKDIDEDYNERNTVEFNEYWTYQTRYVGNVRWLTEYLKTNNYEHSQKENVSEEDYSTDYSYGYIYCNIENYHYKVNEINTAYKDEHDDFVLLRRVIPKEELDKIYDLNNYPELKQKIEEVISNKDVIEHYKAQCKRRDDTRKKKEDKYGLNAGRYIGGTSM